MPRGPAFQVFYNLLETKRAKVVAYAFVDDYEKETLTYNFGYYLEEENQTFEFYDNTTEPGEHICSFKVDDFCYLSDITFRANTRDNRVVHFRLFELKGLTIR